MPTSDPLDILLAQHRWATHRLLDACAALDDEAFHRSFEMGPGSLHDLLLHVLGAMQGWGDMLAGREQRPRLDEEGARMTLDEMRSRFDDLSDDLEASARAHPLDEEVSAERGGRRWTFRRGAVLTHLLTHGMHHRAQALNMLRHVGAEEPPPSSVLEWILHEDH